MGYYIEQLNSEFNMKGENIEPAYNTFLDYIKDNKELVNAWAWLDADELLGACNFAQLMEFLRWEVTYDDDNNIIDIIFMGEKAGAEEQYFNILAPFIESGSYIEMCGEDGNRWKYYFNGDSCITQYPEITYDNIYESICKSIISHTFSDDYLRELCIFKHLRECLIRYDQLTLADKEDKSSYEYEYKKELMDLFILLEIERQNHPNLYNKRLEQFYKKGEK